MAGPTVSVIIQCYQAQSTIPLQLASLSGQLDARPRAILWAVTGDQGEHDSLPRRSCLQPGRER